MRVILVGGPADRDRLREQMNGSMTVVAEFPTIAAARRSDLDVDAMLIAPDTVHAEALDNDDSLDEPLTPREIQVLELLAEGLPNKTIAARLGISDQTVKFHVAAICGKLGAANRTEAVRRAIRRGLVSL